MIYRRANKYCMEVLVWQAACETGPSGHVRRSWFQLVLIASFLSIPFVAQKLVLTSIFPGFNPACLKLYCY